MALRQRRERVVYSEDEQVEVPHADDMDNDIFLKHIAKRHKDDTGTEQMLHKSPHIMDAWVGPYRAFHELMHRTNPSEFYDHVHVWDDDGDDD